MRRIRTFLALPRRRKALFAEALVRLAVAWLLVRLVPFRLWSGRLGALSSGERVSEASAPIELLADVRWAVRRANRATGERLTCLMQAMAGKRILARRGVPATIVLGVKPRGFSAPSGATGPTPPADPSDPSAHAWLRVGERVLLGGEERPGFIPVASYSSD